MDEVHLLLKTHFDCLDLLLVHTGNLQVLCDHEIVFDSLGLYLVGVREKLIDQLGLL